jgi:hypothetical protein
MEARTYHGKVTPRDLADVLVSRFTTDDLSATAIGEGDRIIVNISSAGYQGGRTALAVGLSPASGGVLVTVGDHNLLGVAADLMQTGLGALRNPFVLIGELDDVARNVEKLNLPAQVWEAVDHYCQSVGAGLTAEPTSVTCPYCGVLSPIGAGSCAACGAPLGRSQPVTCPKCGKLLPADLDYCTRCGSPLRAGVARPATSQGEGRIQEPPRPSIIARFGQ